MNNSESVTNLENRMLENIGILDLETMIKKWNFWKKKIVIVD